MKQVHGQELEVCPVYPVSNVALAGLFVQLAHAEEPVLGMQQVSEIAIYAIFNQHLAQMSKTQLGKHYTPSLCCS